MSNVLIWLLLTVAFLLLEFITVGALVSIWFCAGSFVALLATLLGAPVWLQVTLFFVSSVLLLAGTKPFLKKLVTPKQLATNADRIVNTVGIVEEEIDNLNGMGSIKIDGKFWTARNLEGNDIIAVNTEVLVEKIEGVKAMVKPIDCESDLLEGTKGE